LLLSQCIHGCCCCPWLILLFTSGCSHLQYEPELFPGLIYRMKEPKIVLLIFVSGKVVLTGARGATPCRLCAAAGCAGCVVAALLGAVTTGIGRIRSLFML
jgi:hypothetical protein